MNNKIANAIMILGVLEIVLGFVLGLVFGYDYYVEWGILLTWFTAGVVSGIITIGFAQIIEILHQINLKLKPYSSEETGEDNPVIESEHERADDNKFKL